jgi:putative hemolysin
VPVLQHIGEEEATRCVTVNDMSDKRPPFEVRLARDVCDLEAAQSLRYRVFVQELGAAGPLVDHVRQLERDRFDPHVDHMIVVDTTTGDVVGVYRLVRAEAASAAGGYYTDSEYDLSLLLSSGRRLLELGRSCLHPDYRGGMAMFHLWNGLAEYIALHRIELLFGVASFHGTDISRLADALSLLHHRHLAPPEFRVRARAPGFQRMDLIAEHDLDRRRATLAVPALIKAYLRLGGCVGEGAFIDHLFNTTDVCLILDTTRIDPRRAKLYPGATQ